MNSFFTKFIQDESGQDLVEYALLLSVLAVAAVSTLGALATTISGKFTSIGTTISGS